MNTKQIVLSSIIMTFSISLNFFKPLIDIPISMFSMILFYPLLTGVLWVYFFADTGFHMYRLCLMSQGFMLTMQGTEDCPEIIGLMNMNQLFIFSCLIYTVGFLISSVGIMSALNKIGYYRRLNEIYVRLMV